MKALVTSAFSRLVDTLASELRVMPLSRWNESVLRYHFGRIIATEHGDVEQFVECDHIDLVLRRGDELAFIEFKFYVRPIRLDPYELTALGFKGGPSRKNLEEFRTSIDRLHSRRSRDGLTKFVLLAYADSDTSQQQGITYGAHYDRYQHSDGSVEIRVVASRELSAADERVCLQLFEVV